MKKEIKKRFKCKFCKDKYPITLNMVRDVYNVTGLGTKQFAKAFNCPTCGTIYCNWGYGNRWTHETWEFFDVK